MHTYKVAGRLFYDMACEILSYYFYLDGPNIYKLYLQNQLFIFQAWFLYKYKISCHSLIHIMKIDSYKISVQLL